MSGVKENCTRVEAKEKEEASKRDVLADKLNKVLEKQVFLYQ